MELPQTPRVEAEDRRTSALRGSENLTRYAETITTQGTRKFFFTHATPAYPPLFPNSPRGFRIRRFTVCLLSVSIAAYAADPTPTAPLRGYTAEHSAAEVQWEQKFRAIPDADRL